MDRNSILGITLIATIFIVWGIVSQPSAEDRARQITADSLRRAEQVLSPVVANENIVSNTTDSNFVAKTDTLDSLSAHKLYGDFANAALGENKFIVLENDLIVLTLSEKGGKPYSVQLKNYKTHDAKSIYLFNGDSSVFGLNFYAQNRHLNTNDLYFVPQTAGNLTVTDSPVKLAMRLNAGEGRYIEYRYTLKPNEYMVDLEIEFSGLDNISTKRTGVIDLDWSYFSPQQEKGRDNELSYTTLYYRPHEEDVESLSALSKKQALTESITTKIDWVGYKAQFFSSVLIAENAFTDAEMTSESQPVESKYLKKFTSSMGVNFEGGSKQVVPLHFYFGPNKYKLLKKNYGKYHLQDLVAMGSNIIKVINRGVIIPIFDFLHRFINNFGIIILLLTIIIKLALLPLTFKSYQSTAKMKVLKPQIDEINERISKDKPMERQQATMALYKKVGVSPLGGCLPMLLQMPILFAMFRFFPSSIELRQQSFLWAHDLSTYDAIYEWTAQIPLLSRFYGNHISLFTILMTVTTLMSMKMSNQNNVANQQMAGMQTMMYVMPVIFMFVLNKYSAGLTYYYFLANVITIGQNYLFKLFIDEKALLSKLEARKAKPVKKSGFQQKLELMAKQQAAKSGRK